MQTSTVYNALGQAVSMVDGAGYRSYKVYDLQGQVAYEVDSVGDVTAYGRDSFGQAVSLKRFATAINLPAGALALNLHDVETRLQANPAQDREIVTVFDKLGRAVEVREPSVFNFDANVNRSAAAGQQYFASGKVTRNTYNVFGDLVRVSTLENALTDTWSSVNHYFDKHGQCIETIDALGYVTTYGYDTQGNTIAKFESAKAIVNWDGSAAPSTLLETLSALESQQDRFTSMEYDLNNRAIKQVFSDRQHLNEVDAQHVSTNEYDNVGNVTVKRAWGPGSHGAALATRNFYDALGRVVAVIDGSRSNREQGVDINPLEVYTYDALGNMTQMTSYAKGAKNDLEAIPRELDSADRTTTYKYDAFGHALQVTDANHIEHNSEYDGRGLLTREWTKSATGQAIANITKTYDAVGRLETDSATDQVNVYNAFGEITVQTLGTTVNHYEFDQAGRMWRTDQGGVVQVNLYDLHDKIVATLTSAGMANGNRDLKQAANAEAIAQATDVRRTDYRFDADGNNVAQILAERNGRRIVIHQSFDRWGNLLTKSDPTVAESQDAITRYTYDEMNRVTSERNPQADGTEGGRVREYIYTTGDFDAVLERRTIDRENASVTSASDNDDLHQRYRVITETYNQSGKLLSSKVNETVTEAHEYDLFAQVIADLIGGKKVANYKYDKLGHVVEESHLPVDVYTVITDGSTLSLGAADHVTLVNKFEYDELGHLKKMINTAEDVSLYAHDMQGNLTQFVDAMGHVTSYTWDKNGHKLSMTDAMGGSTHWNYASDGKLASITNYDGTETVYSYDKAGQLVQTLNAAKGHTVTNTYDAAGQLLQINDVSTSYSGLVDSGGSNLNSFGEERFIDGISPQNSYSNISKITTYGYDSVGNRTREITEQNGQRYQDNELSYDALHRLTNVLAHDAVEGDQVVRYEYDNFGNRTRFTAISAGTEEGRNENGYFFFDAVNRVIRSGALDAQGTVGGSTFRYAYDAAGNVRSRVMGVGRTEKYEYDDMNRRISTEIDGSLHYIRYDKGSRIVDEWVQVKDVPVAHAGVDRPADPNLVEPTAPTVPPEGSTQAVMDQYNLERTKYLQDKVVYENKRQLYLDDVQNYDEQEAYANRVNAEAKADLGLEHHLRSYNQNGQVVREQAFQDNGSVKFHQFNSVIDALGNTLHYVTDSFVGDSATSTYDNIYMNGLFGRQLATSTGYLHMNQGQLAGRTGGASTSTMIYDANANLSEVLFQTSDKTTPGSPSRKQMYYDAEGHILQSVEVDVKAKTITQREIIVNGDLQLRYTSTVGSFGGDAKQSAAYEEGIANQASQTPLSYVALQADGTPQNSGRVLVAYDGENLRSIALRVYGNADKWYQLADANRLDPNQSLNGGQSLIVPAIIGGTDSRLDYNNSKLIGTTAPDLPPPEPNQKKGCATLIVIVIAVVASCVLGPEMLLLVQSVMGPGLAATVVAGALTGAAVSVVSQGAGMALGVQDRFSWKAVGQGFIGGGVAAGFSSVAGISPVASNAGSFSMPNLGIAIVNGAMRSAVTQIVQGHFSWRQVAASAAMAGAGNAVSQSFAMANYDAKMNDGANNESAVSQSSKYVPSFGERVTTSIASSIVSSAIMNKGKIDLRNIGINAFASVGAQYLGDYAASLGGEGSVGHSLAHAALGAATARMRRQDAWAGAIGAGVGAFVAPRIKDAMGEVGLPTDVTSTMVESERVTGIERVTYIDEKGQLVDAEKTSYGIELEEALYNTNKTGQLITSLTEIVAGGVSRAFGHGFDVAAGAADNSVSSDYLAQLSQSQMDTRRKELQSRSRVEMVEKVRLENLPEAGAGANAGKAGIDSLLSITNNPDTKGSKAQFKFPAFGEISDAWKDNPKFAAMLKDTQTSNKTVDETVTDENATVNVGSEDVDKKEIGPRKYTIKKDDALEKISRELGGENWRAMQGLIFAQNRDKIKIDSKTGNPLVQVGQEIIISDLSTFDEAAQQQLAKFGGKITANNAAIETMNAYNALYRKVNDFSGFNQFEADLKVKLVEYKKQSDAEINEQQAREQKQWELNNPSQRQTDQAFYEGLKDRAVDRRDIIGAAQYVIAELGQAGNTIAHSVGDVLEALVNDPSHSIGVLANGGGEGARRIVRAGGFGLGGLIVTTDKLLGTQLSDSYFKFLDLHTDENSSMADYYRIDPNASRTDKILYGMGSMTPVVMLTGGNAYTGSAVSFATTLMNNGADLVNEGVSAEVALPMALKDAAVDGGTTFIGGMKYFGGVNALTKTTVAAIGVNVGNNELNRVILDGLGYQEAADRRKTKVDDVVDSAVLNLLSGKAMSKISEKLGSKVEIGKVAAEETEHASGIREQVQSSSEGQSLSANYYDRVNSGSAIRASSSLPELPFESGSTTRTSMAFELQAKVANERTSSATPLIEPNISSGTKGTDDRNLGPSAVTRPLTSETGLSYRTEPIANSEIVPKVVNSGNEWSPPMKVTVEPQMIPEVSVRVQNGSERIDPSRVKLSRDDYSFKGTIIDDPKAYVRAQVPHSGTVEVTDIFRGNLPKGSGADFLAQVLQGHKELPVERLVFKNITNKPTISAFESGMNPADSLLGKTGTTALEKMGLTPNRFAFDVERGKLNLTIETAGWKPSGISNDGPNSSLSPKFYGECFVAGTAIHTESGVKPIESIAVGDIVAARNEFTGETSWRPVKQLFNIDDKIIVDVTLRNAAGLVETISATNEHPFFEHERGWRAAKDLAPGQSIVLLDGGSAEIVSVREQTERATAYNFEVADVHTYFVGEMGVWVHNSSKINWADVKKPVVEVKAGGAKRVGTGSSYEFELYKKQLLAEEIAKPGEAMSGPVVFRDPKAGATAAQVADIRRAVDLANLAIAEGYMSPTGRVSTQGATRAAADRAVDIERAAAKAAGTPYKQVVGHGPDTTWTNRPVAPFWQDMDRSINSSLGRQAQDYPIGYKPTRFIYLGDL